MKRNFLFLLLIVFASCNTFYQPKTVSYNDYRISGFRNKDTAMTLLLKKYSDSVNSTMFFVIGNATSALEKKQPNGSMGMFFSDALKEGAALKYKKNVDAAFINNGGLRVPVVAAGDITVGKIYEVMPFDNLVVLQTISGKVFKEFLDLIARKGGWPVSGVTFDIINGKAQNVLVSNAPLEANKMYTIANSDYIANGGDDCEMLQKLARENNNILMRDIFIDYIKMQTANGKKIVAPMEDRITLK